MKSSILVLTALFAAAWAAAPSLARAHDDKKGKVVEKEVRIETGDQDRDAGNAGNPGGNPGGDLNSNGGREPAARDAGGPDGGGPRGRRGGPNGGGSGVGPGWMRGGPTPELRAKFDKVRELEEKLRDLGRKLSTGTDADKTAGKAEARKVVGELFDKKMDLDATMIEMAEKNLADMKERLAKRKANRERAIETRVARVAGEVDDWD